MTWCPSHIRACPRGGSPRVFRSGLGFSSWFCTLLLLLLYLLCSSAADICLCSERITQCVPLFSERVRATFSARSWEPSLSSRCLVGTVSPLHPSRVDTQWRRFQDIIFSSSLCFFFSSCSLEHCTERFCDLIPYHNTVVLLL